MFLIFLFYTYILFFMSNDFYLKGKRKQKAKNGSKDEIRQNKKIPTFLIDASAAAVGLRV